VDQRAQLSDDGERIEECGDDRQDQSLEERNDGTRPFNGILLDGVVTNKRQAGLLLDAGLQLCGVLVVVSDVETMMRRRRLWVSSSPQPSPEASPSAQGHSRPALSYAAYASPEVEEAAKRQHQQTVQEAEARQGWQQRQEEQNQLCEELEQRDVPLWRISGEDEPSIAVQGCCGAEAALRSSSDGVMLVVGHSGSGKGRLCERLTSLGMTYKAWPAMLRSMIEREVPGLSSEVATSRKSTLPDEVIASVTALELGLEGPAADALVEQAKASITVQGVSLC